MKKNCISHWVDIKFELDLSNCATKTDLKNVRHVDVSSFASKTNLTSLKTEVDQTDVDKLKTVPVDLAKLSDVVKNDVVKKTEYNSLKTKVNSIGTTNFVLKTKYEKDGSDFEDKISKIDKKIPDVSDLAKKTDFNAKVTEIEGKIPSISGLATNTALTAVENKIPDVSSIVVSHVNNEKNNILVLAKDFVQGINGTTIYAEKLYKINFTEKNKTFWFKLALQWTKQIFIC